MSVAMSAEIGNLGLLVVNEEIDNALELYPDNPYKMAFANPELRQKLVNYVASGLRAIYPALGNKHSLPVKTRFPYRSLELRLHVENYVHWGIEHLLEINSNSVDYLITQEAQPSTCFHWFS